MVETSVGQSGREGGRKVKRNEIKMSWSKEAGIKRLEGVRMEVNVL